MLQLFFDGIGSAQSFAYPEATEFRFEWGLLRSRMGREVARCSDCQWGANDSFYTHLEFSGPVAVQFENPNDGTSEECGQFEKVDLYGCMLRGGGRYLANLTPEGEWSCQRTGVLWPVVVLRSVRAVDQPRPSTL